MSNVLVGTSFVASFIAGTAALFAPCCITVLLPSYLGSVFRERRTVFLMTFLFFLGILVVFLPLGLGIAAFGQLLTRYHNAIFIAGGMFLLALGASLVLGRHFSLPWTVSPKLERHHPFAVFTLGVFSGIATTCCAPVLAGVLALAVLPGSVLLGGAYTLAYVLGMVTPLFFLATLLDKTRATERLLRFRAPLDYRMFGRTVRVTVTDLIAGILFLGMGVLTISLALGNRLAVHAGYQVSFNIWMARMSNALNGTVQLVPQWVWATMFTLFLLGLLVRALHVYRKE